MEKQIIARLFDEGIFTEQVMIDLAVSLDLSQLEVATIIDSCL